VAERVRLRLSGNPRPPASAHFRDDAPVAVATRPPIASPVPRRPSPVAIGLSAAARGRQRALRSPHEDTRMTPLVPLHVLAGATALAAGATAMVATKGSPLHRRAGTVFAVAMLVMASTGAGMAAPVGERVSVLAGLLTFYMVASGWLTVRRTVAQARSWLVAGTTFALGLAATALFWGLTTLPGSGMTPVLFVFGSIALLAGLLDARLLRAGAIAGAHRLARHLWRMGFAMFVATGSFFLGQADEIPAPLRIYPLLALPVIAVVAFTPFWLVRVLRRGRRVSAPMTASDATT
jgi:uncharacterized membrane protein